MKIIVGLGNIGKEYENTRHNVAWMFLDYLQEKLNFKITENNKSLDCITSQVYINNEKVIFVKPTTYMNLSGHAVQKLKKWYKVDDDELLIIFDDIDIPFGETRYKLNGSGGTHNGMKNVVQMLNTKNIARLKIGIGGIKHEKQDLVSFVLQKFTKEQIKDLEIIFDEAYEKLKIFLDK